MPKKVLIVDDKEENRVVLENFFQFFGLNADIILLFADNSKLAYEITQKEKPDLILLDIFIESRTSGLELAKKIRDTIKDKDIAIWAITAQAMRKIEEEDSDEEKCIKHGCNKYFSKPFDQRQLLIETSKLLNIPIPERIKKRMNIDTV